MRQTPRIIGGVLALLFCCSIFFLHGAAASTPAAATATTAASTTASDAATTGSANAAAADSVTLGADGGEIRRFKIHVPDADLAELRTKLTLTRLPAADDEADPSRAWERGINLRYLSSLMDYWREQYDWRAREKELNALDHYTTSIDEYTQVHFVHARSSRSDAVPLLFVHGWPGSFLECVKIIPLLTQPPNASTPAFHVVCPSIPGYGYSSARSGQHTTVRDAAAVFVKLMARLGYDKYVTQGGDWGAVVGTHVAMLDPEHCRGLHLNAAPVGPPLALFATRNPLYALWRGFNTLLDLVLPYSWRFPSAEASILQKRGLEFLVTNTGYFHQQATRPDTLGVGLHDSPAGLAAWLAEKLHAWADMKRDLITGAPSLELDSVFSKQDVLDHVSLYYLSGSITSSMRLYYETMHAGFMRDAMSFDVKQPTAFAAFPAELLFAPRKWMADYFHLVRYTVQSAGGHFAAMEQPDLLVEDVRQFVAHDILPKHWDRHASAASQPNQPKEHTSRINDEL